MSTPKEDSLIRYRDAVYRYAGDIDLHDWLYESEAFDVLDPDWTWSAGGCWVLALVLKRVLGDEARLMAVHTDYGLDHVVVEYGGKLWDSDGPQTATELIDKWVHEELRPSSYLTEFSPEEAKQRGTPCPLDKVDELERLLRRDMMEQIK